MVHDYYGKVVNVPLTYEHIQSDIDKKFEANNQALECEQSEMKYHSFNRVRVWLKGPAEGGLRVCTEC